MIYHPTVTSIIHFPLKGYLFEQHAHADQINIGNMHYVLDHLFLPRGSFNVLSNFQYHIVLAYGQLDFDLTRELWYMSWVQKTILSKTISQFCHVSNVFSFK